jgi:hypothetical protein
MCSSLQELLYVEINTFAHAVDINFVVAGQEVRNLCDDMRVAAWGALHISVRIVTETGRE